MSYFYKLYDSDFDTTETVNTPTMTVKELKVTRGIKTGSWFHPDNHFMIQRYQVEIYNPVLKKWTILTESDVIDFTKDPRLKIQLIHN
jgi:hypothetical protein